MIKPPIPANESARLEALRQYEILDTDPEESFNDLTRLAAYICGTPIALISLVDQNRQWFKAREGIDAEETARDVSFCAHALEDHMPLIVRDVMHDERFADNPLVTSEPNIRFYAGAPLVSPEGFIIGTLCVIDRIPRDLKPEQIAALRMLGRQVMTQLELRRDLAYTSRALEKHMKAEEELRVRLSQSN
ncbi:MAG TPA: GAF domain-containing protein [Pyrinomonadaceae bacterium]|nr:GAF domain-containing protein [Pyrinomonadaceae bacterium]